MTVKPLYPWQTDEGKAEYNQTDGLDVSVPIPNIPNREVSFSQFLLQGRCEKCLV